MKFAHVHAMPLPSAPDVSIQVIPTYHTVAATSTASIATPWISTGHLSLDQGSPTRFVPQTPQHWYEASSGNVQHIGSNSVASRTEAAVQNTVNTVQSYLGLDYARVSDIVEAAELKPLIKEAAEVFKSKAFAYAVVFYSLNIPTDPDWNTRLHVGQVDENILVAICSSCLPFPTLTMLARIVGGYNSIPGIRAGAGSDFKRLYLSPGAMLCLKDHLSKLIEAKLAENPNALVHNEAFFEAYLAQRAAFAMTGESNENEGSIDVQVQHVQQGSDQVQMQNQVHQHRHSAEPLSAQLQDCYRHIEANDHFCAIKIPAEAAHCQLHFGLQLDEPYQQLDSLGQTVIDLGPSADAVEQPFFRDENAVGLDLAHFASTSQVQNTLYPQANIWQVSNYDGNNYWNEGAIGAAGQPPFASTSQHQSYPHGVSRYDGLYLETPFAQASQYAGNASIEMQPRHASTSSGSAYNLPINCLAQGQYSSSQTSNLQDFRDDYNYVAAVNSQPQYATGLPNEGLGQQLAYDDPSSLPGQILQVVKMDFNEVDVEPSPHQWMVGNNMYQSLM